VHVSGAIVVQKQPRRRQLSYEQVKTKCSADRDSWQRLLLQLQVLRSNIHKWALWKGCLLGNVSKLLVDTCSSWLFCEVTPSAVGE
jgi:hypothetical protein